MDIVCSASMLTSFLQCRKRLRLELDGWRRIERSEALVFGGLWHRLMEGMVDHYRGGKPPSGASIETNLDLTIGSEERAVRRVRPFTADDAERLLLLRVQLAVVLHAYCTAWAEDFKKGKAWHAVESRLETNYGDVKLVGRIDRLEERKDGRFVLHELKTAGQIRPDEIELYLPLDLQSNFYALLVERVYGKRPAEIIRDLTRRPSFKLGAKETLPQYEDRLAADIEERPDHYFQRYTMPLLKRDLDEFEANFQKILAEYVGWFNSDPDGGTVDYWNPVACQSGRITCDFLSMCGTGSTEGYYNENDLKKRRTRHAPKKAGTSKRRTSK